MGDIFYYPNSKGWDELEEYDLNPRAKCLRVLPSLKQVKAPLTQVLTVCYNADFRADNNSRKTKFVIFVNSVYPGESVGELVGNMTEKTGLVWFDWHHQGEELGRKADELEGAFR